MRILHVTSYYKPAWNLGGPVHSVSRLCEGLSQLDAYVEVFTSDVAGPSERLSVPLGRCCSVDGVKVTYLPAVGYWRFYIVPSLVSWLLKRVDEFDIVHVTGSFSFFQLAWVITTLRTAIPFVISPRGSFMPNAMRRGTLKRLKKVAFIRAVESPVVNRCSAVHCVTDMERKAVKKYFPKASTFVIPNGLDLSEFESLPEKGRLRRRLGIKEDRFVCLYLGRLHPHKGLDLTINAFSSALKEGLKAELIVAGNPEFGSDKEWRDLTTKKGIFEHVRFVGHVSGVDKQECFADSDALVLNSYSENFGISVAEALVCGLPVIVSNQAGISDWVLENQAGLVVPQDVSAIADAMMHMTVNRDRFQAAAQTAKLLARVDFDHRTIARRMLEQYDAILTTGRPMSDLS